MRKQLAKGFTMLMLVVALAFVTAVASANGQSRQSRASIPFDFVVGDKTLAAGNYAVDSVTAGGECLRVSNIGAKGVVARLTTPLNGTSKHDKMVFHRYGQSYFLAEIWTDGGSQGRQLMKSKQERAIEKENGRLASLSGHAAPQTYETVAIATKVN